MPRIAQSQVRIDIEKFLNRERNRWFTAKEIAEQIDRPGKQISNQLHTAVYRNRCLFICEAKVGPKKIRLYYGCFSSKYRAAQTPPINPNLVSCKIF